MNKLTNEDFLKKCKQKHGDKYQYLDVYINSSTEIRILCPEHGLFIQVAHNHTRGVGCRKCGVIKAHQKFKRDTNWFIKTANKKHSNKYDYSKTIYLGSQPKLIITCRKHGEFEQKAYSHLAGKGCKKCNSSIGEQKVRYWLTENNIDFVEQKRFKTCKYIKTLSFDFYIKSLNLLIEFDGEQHFTSKNKKNKRWDNPIEKFEIIKLRDKIKNQWCIDNGIDLFRIKFTQNVFKVLKKKIYG